MKRLFLAIVLVIALLTFPAPKAHAFWGTILGSPATASAQILIGEWNQFPLWQPDEEYTEGDIVYWEGQFWVRTRQAGGSNVEPGSPAGWVF